MVMFLLFVARVFGLRDWVLLVGWMFPLRRFIVRWVLRACFVTLVFFVACVLDEFTGVRRATIRR